MIVELFLQCILKCIWRIIKWNWIQQATFCWNFPVRHNPKHHLYANTSCRIMLRRNRAASEQLEHLYIIYDGQRSLPEEILCGAFKSMSKNPFEGVRGLLYYLNWNAASDRLGYETNGKIEQDWHEVNMSCNTNEDINQNYCMICALYVYICKRFLTCSNCNSLTGISSPRLFRYVKMMLRPMESAGHVWFI